MRRETAETWWTMVLDAGAGDAEARAHFSLIYAPVVRSCFEARWRGSPLSQDIDDACQQVFLECFKADGALSRVSRHAGPGFRPFLFGVVRNVAHRVERSSSRAQARRAEAVSPEAVASEDTQLTVAFDRAWAEALVAEAMQLHADRAAAGTLEFRTRHEALQAVLDAEDSSIREIALSRGTDPERFYREHARARLDFRDCLREVVAFHTGQPASAADVECRKLIGLLQG